MKCPRCQFISPDDSTFCQQCGYRLDAATPASARQSSDVPEPARPSAVTAPASHTGGGTRRYFTASAVITTLMILGWLTVAGGVLGGIGVAADCKESSSSDFFTSSSTSCDAGKQIGLFLLVVIVAWIIAIGFFWSGYVLRFLSDIDTSLRSGRRE